MGPELIFTTKIRLRSSATSSSSWHFVSLDAPTKKHIDHLTKDRPRRGRGSHRVKVRIGYVTRTTSIFPDKQSGTYLLPIKASVREELNLHADDQVTIYLSLEETTDV